jgi:hypothetical protein
LEQRGYIPWWRAFKIVAYYGYLKNSNSQKFLKAYDVKRVLRLSKKSVSYIGKSKEVIGCERILCSEAG